MPVTRGVYRKRWQQPPRTARFIPSSPLSFQQRSCGTGANVTGIGTKAWANPGNITTNDGSYAVATFTSLGQVTNYLVASNFGFTIPTGSIIRGVMVEIERKSDGSMNAYDFSIKLYNGSATIGSSLDRNQAADEWPTADAFAAYGGLLAASGINPISYNVYAFWDTIHDMRTELINDSGFGVAISAGGDTGSVYVDHVHMTVWYSSPATPNVAKHRKPTNSLRAEPVPWYTW